MATGDLRLSSSSRARIARVTLVCIASLALGCGRSSSRRRRPETRSGTQRMADTLAAIYAQALRSSEPNIFLNRERVIAIKARLALQSGGEALNSRHWIAEELLRAGQTREAIAELESVMRDGRLTGDTITPQTKPVFDLLALAYLRLGEQENCLDNPAANVCILPLKGGGRHTHQEGARGAIARYTELLRHFPDDHGSKWLLNIAYLAIGGYPDSIPKRYLIPNLAPAREATPSHSFPTWPARWASPSPGSPADSASKTSTATASSMSSRRRGGLTSRCTSSWPTARAGTSITPRSRDSTESSAASTPSMPITTTTATSTSWCCGAPGSARPASIPNRSCATAATAASRTSPSSRGSLSFHPSQTAAWADFNLDGYLDLFIGNESAGLRRARRIGPSSSSTTATAPSPKSPARSASTSDDFVKGVVWGDVNNDGLPDLYASVIYGRNRLFVNLGGSFYRYVALRGTRRGRGRRAADACPSRPGSGISIRTAGRICSC